MLIVNVSCIKNAVLLVLFLSIFLSCSDEDLFTSDIEQNLQENITESPDSPQGPVPSDSTNVDQSEQFPSDSTFVDPSVQNPPDSTIVETQDPFSTCFTSGGKAYVTGLKVFCWESIDIPSYSGKRGINISNDQLFIDNECNEDGVTKVGNELRFYLNPTEPETSGSWCTKDFNIRAEVRTHPWEVKNPTGTEEWFGFTYRFGANYKPDQDNQWLFFQVHSGGGEPTTELRVSRNKQYSGHPAGEIFVINKGNKEELPTGIIPKANDKLKIVVHAIWDFGDKGLLQVWINDVLVHNRRVSTIYTDAPWGGNAKFGVYKWPWKDASQVQKSHDQGINYLETFMGTLKIITRQPGDEDYGKDSYSLVAPY